MESWFCQECRKATTLDSWLVEFKMLVRYLLGYIKRKVVKLHLIDWFRPNALWNRQSLQDDCPDWKQVLKDRKQTQTRWKQTGTTAETNRVRVLWIFPRKGRVAKPEISLSSIQELKKSWRNAVKFSEAVPIIKASTWQYVRFIATSVQRNTTKDTEDMSVMTSTNRCS